MAALPVSPGMKLSSAAWGIPSVATLADRDVLFPFPPYGQKVYRLDTGVVQCYTTGWHDITARITDFPAGARTVTTLGDYHAGEATAHNIIHYGASTDASAAVNAAAISAAAAAAGSTGLLYFPAGTYASDGTCTVLGPCSARGARINYSGTGIAIQVGNGSALVENATIELPEVIQTLKAGGTLGWSRSDTGVKLVRVFNSRVTVPYVRNFAIGCNVHGEAEGCDYNTLLIGHLSNNKVNFKVTGDATGWTNENTILAGRLSHDPAELQAPNTTTSGQPGVRHIQFVKPASQVLNNWRFYGTSLEGDVTEFIADVQGQHVYFDRCRWEGVVPKVRFDGADSVYNQIRGGYDANRVVLTHSNGAGQTTVESQVGTRSNIAPGDAVHVLANADSSATPTLIGLAAGQSPFAGTAANLANYSWALSAQSLRGKLTADATDRLKLNFETGEITAAALLVGGSAAATTLGSVVKRVPIYNSTGTLLGYLPIYNSIT